MAGNKVKLTIVGDSKSGIRALDETAAASDKTADTQEVNNKRVQESYEQTGERVSKFGETVKGLAETVGITGLGFGIAEVVKSGESWQKQQTALGQALKNTGQYSAGLVKSLSDSADQLSTKGGYNASEQLAGITSFVTETGSATKAMKANVAVMNVARATGKTYAQAQTMYASALAGTPGRLSKLIGPFIAVTKYTAGWTAALEQAYPKQYQHAQMLNKQATAAELTARIQQKLGGQMQAYSKTAAGSISNIENQLDNSLKNLGVEILPVVAKVIGALAGIVKWVVANRKEIVGFAEAAAPFVAIWGVYKLINFAKDAVVGFKSALVALRLATIAGTEEQIAFDTALDANPIGIVITAVAALVAGLIELYEHSAKFRSMIKDVGQVAGQVFKAIEGVVSGAFNWVKSHWPLLLGILTAPFGGPLIIFIVRHFGQIKTEAKAVIKEIDRIWHGLVSVLEWPFKEAWKVIDGIYKKIKDAAHFVTHSIGSALGTSGGGGLLHGFGLFHTGGPVKLATGGSLGATGGAIGGYGGGDRIPALLEQGEYVMRKEAVQQVGVNNLNAINASGSIAAASAGGMFEATVPIVLQVGQEALARIVAHTALKKTAVTGAMGLV